MAKALMIRPQMAALWGPRFFSTISSSPAAAKPFRRQLTSAALLLQKMGPRGGSHILGQKPNDLVPVYRRGLCVRASTTDSGFIDSPLIQSMENKIKEQLSADSVVVRDINGDGRHVCIDVIASSFEGKSAVNRQRMVYKAIWEELQNTVHAVDQMTTKTPSEAECKCGMPLCICEAPAPNPSPAQLRDSWTTSTSTLQSNPKPKKVDTKPKSRGSTSNSKQSLFSSGPATNNILESNTNYEVNGEGLRESIKNGDTAAIKKLLNEGVDANYRDKQGLSLLHLAAVFNKTDMFCPHGPWSKLDVQELTGRNTT